ncbi:phosphoribosylglycinamide formyltransferase [Marasmitruncus massiliensis]|uniref:phosphoribosylglycinamide formyltransferase n=1 Tax=Marasmitruncus massiliensis TaxID=1944642 RepID=UPI000C7C56E9
MKRVVVLVSGGGTNLQALIDAQDRGEIKNGEIVGVISSREDVFALERAKKAGIPAVVLSRRSFSSREDYDSALLAELRKLQADLVVLAGFLCILGETVVQAYDRRIINVHPSLIPSFCGDGFYGLKVHEEALRYGVKVTGATVHFVDQVTDGGQIILQKAVPVEEGDTPETLQKRVMEQAEWELLPRAVSLFCEGKIK